MKNAADHKASTDDHETMDSTSESSMASMETPTKELDVESAHTLASTFLNDEDEGKGDLLECS